MKGFIDYAAEGNDISIRKNYFLKNTKEGKQTGTSEAKRRQTTRKPKTTGG